MSSRPNLIIRARRAATRTALMSATVLAAGTAFAQDASTPVTAEQTSVQSGSGSATPAPDAAPNASGEIVVTGSRVAQTGFAAPTPTQVIGADLIARQQQATVAAVLYQNPAFKATRSASGNAVNTSNPGQATADLRALGGQRTLVLVNGARVVPSAPSNNLGVPVATDLNLIPTLMIDRVEVVTGGASAQYGSDAVAGVVGIQLKRKVDGIQLTAQSGISQQGDNFNWRVGGVTGTSFADDRAHVVVSAEYSKSNGFRDFYSRDWGRQNYQLINNSQRLTNGLPAFILSSGVVNNVGEGSIILGAVRPTGAAGGTNFNTAAGQSLLRYTFNPDGSIRPHNDGSFSNGTVQIGGEGDSPLRGSSVIPAVQRFTSYGRLEFQASDAATFFIEGGYSRSHSILFGNTPRFNPLTIQRDNAYIPAAVRAALNAPANLNATGFTISRQGFELGNIKVHTINSTPHVMAGVEGDLGGSWHYDAHYSFGVNNYRSRFENNLITANYTFATDAVAYNPTTNAIFNFANGATTPPAGYVIGCRALVPGSSTYNPTAAAGCQPINWFGQGNISSQARGYVMGNGYSTTRYRQNAAAANLRGQPFSTWAGPVGTAVGVEYRRESQLTKTDPIAAANGFTSAGNAAPFAAYFDVKEAYAEAIVPLLRDSFFASADLNGAIRYADYSTVGGQTTWKFGGVVEPIRGLRLRATKSRDIRAPALFELYSPGSDVTNNVTVANPVTKASQNPRIPQNVNIGNRNLNAEKADTWTAGVVVEPQGGLRGLRASVDYYDINIKGAITNLTAANIGTLCTLEVNSGAPGQFCSYFTFNGAGAATALRAPTLNLGSFRNVGIDMALSYTKNLQDWGASGIASISFSGTYVRHAYVDTGVPVSAGGAGPIDRAGENGQANTGAIPHFRGNLSMTYSTDNWSLTSQWLYISKGKNDNTYGTTPALSINDNHVPAITYWNLYGSVKAGPNFEFVMRVDNVLDRDPPPVPYSVLLQPVNGIFYDKIGRAFQFGVNVKF